MKKILVVRFKQIGDSILASPICNTLKKTYPDSQIDYVVYDHIAPVFENCEYIDNVISITKEERKNPFKYISKVWKITRNNYDIIIDIMSTPKSELFTLFGRKAEYRIGRYKKKRGYTYTHSIKESDIFKDKVDKFMQMLEPLEKDGIKLVKDESFPLGVTEDEERKMKETLIKRGVDFSRPIVVYGVNSKRDYRIWPVERALKVIDHLRKKYNAQIMFFHTPNEREFIESVYNKTDKKDIYMDIETKNIRGLMALIKNSDLFIGNDTGPRHIAQGLGIPTLCHNTPSARKKEWIPNPSKSNRGLEAWDFASDEEIDKLEHWDRFKLITTEAVIKEADEMMELFVKEKLK